MICTARRFRAACRDCRLAQEFITPYTPEQNGMIERFFRSLKEECVWQHNFASFADLHPLRRPRPCTSTCEGSKRTRRCHCV